ncbi:MAG: isopentenyl phosphate kinase [Anaerolineales bacterium]
MSKENNNHPPFVLLKLGGSLITDKSRPHTHRPEVLTRLAGEIKTYIEEQPGTQLVIGHGSGSFGHVPAKRYKTRQGVHTPEQWRGFSEVWYEASSLTRLVVEALYRAGLPVIALSPSASAISQDGSVLSWELRPLMSALRVGLLPVVHGDVVFDTQSGGTILSTEDLFEHLANQLQPERILLAGIEAGVWADYPLCTRLVEEITPEGLSQIFPSLAESAQVDVTGGMASKVQQSMALIERHPNLVIQVFSGDQPGSVLRALRGEKLGTTLHSGAGKQPDFR